MKNILVTGGAGYIGSHTVVELIKSGSRPIILDNFSGSKPSTIKAIEEIAGSKIIFYEGNYQDKKLLSKIYSEHKFDSIIHFAAYKTVEESINHPLKYYKNNVSGLVTLLEFIAKHKILNFVFSSSANVYGEPDTLPISEESTIKDAVSPYGASKQMCERIIKDFASVSEYLKVVSLRYFNPIGAHSSGKIGEDHNSNPTNIVPRIISSASSNSNFTIFGNDYATKDGTAIRDFIHVTDLARAHISALNFIEDQKPKSYFVFNVGTGSGTSVLQLVEAFKKATGKQLHIKYGARRASDISVSYANVDRANEVLGWKAELGIEQALDDAWRWYERENQ